MKVRKCNLELPVSIYQTTLSFYGSLLVPHSHVY